MTFELPALPYDYAALEPYIDAETMHLHHDKHHAAYIQKLNEALIKHSELEVGSVDELLINLESVPEDIRTVVRNHGGGHANHTLFWESMGANTTNVQGELLIELQGKFGSLEEFKEQFQTAGVGRFGSGWVWLVKDADNKLQIITTANQDSPLSVGLTPLLGNDVWEHAYYLKYQNRRLEYLTAWWSVVNWSVVEQRFAR